jgi:hypothetical protein
VTPSGCSKREQGEKFQACSGTGSSKSISGRGDKAGLGDLTPVLSAFYNFLLTFHTPLTGSQPRCNLHDIQCLVTNFFIGVGALESAGASGPFARRAFVTFQELRLPCLVVESYQKRSSSQGIKRGPWCKSPGSHFGCHFLLLIIRQQLPARWSEYTWPSPRELW